MSIIKKYMYPHMNVSRQMKYTGLSKGKPCFCCSLCPKSFKKGQQHFLAARVPWTRDVPPPPPPPIPPPWDQGSGYPYTVPTRPAI